MSQGRDWRKFDWVLVIAFVLLVMIGCAEIYSSTQIDGVSPRLNNQIARILMGICGFALVLVIDYRTLFARVWVMYGLGVLVLIYVLFFGVVINTAKSWIRVGGITFQPSEIVKIVVIMALAKFLGEFPELKLPPSVLLTASAIGFGPAILIVLQHDLGSALPMFPVVVAMLFTAGVHRRIMVAAILIMALLLVGSWFVLQGYQRERIMVVVDPERDPQGSGYQTRQSIIAIGSGGFLGKGLQEGSQGALGFLPENHTDFIFALVNEEFGLLGGALTLSLFAVMFYRGLRQAFYSTDKVTLYSCVGLTALFASHLTINIGMALGWLPVIGIPLIPMSYGGSSIISAFFALGLMNNLRIHRSFV